MFPHRNIHKYSWNSLDGRIHNQTDHILIDRRWHPNVLDVRSFRRGDCDIDHIANLCKFRERLAVSIQVTEKFDVEGFNLRS
jgi:hypothetical protein